MRVRILAVAFGMTYFTRIERDVGDIWMNATARLHSQEDEAARKIQIAAIPHLIANRTALKRVALVERLELEMDC